MQNATILTIVTLALVTGCAKKPTALEVCAKLEAAGVGTNCRADTPGGLGSAARDKADLDLPSVPGKTGQVLTFERADFYGSTTRAFAAAAMLAGRHQYGNEGKLVFVQLNSDTPDDVGAKAKAVVDGL